ncbi:hypothetical protein GPLA_1309 [Paraglaciecola polaris LMG 21857]|uniref:Uncharacterized protein n=1 Tax=Paraglaciecola polaris LMG 21857 TaxID=1129793 RepID=K6ZTS1_9ALTE|nr:hypothetical protein GPLA_1309 [Paraglaciecola polaris LMG 21857]
MEAHSSSYYANAIPLLTRYQQQFMQLGHADRHIGLNHESELQGRFAIKGI